MPKKKKGSGKLAKMSDEDRIIYLEQQRLAEEEMRKKKEDMLTQYLKDKLAKEEKASKFNLFKLNHQWRNIMREAKSKELKKDIEILSQTFERVVDRKDSVLKSLVKDLEESDEQFMMALRSHLQNVDGLVDLQRQRLEILRKEYDSELRTLKKEFDTEESYIVRQHDKQMEDLQDILFALEQGFSDKEVVARMEFQSMRDEIKNKNLEEKHALRVALESKVEDLWSQFRQALNNYNESTEERKNHFENLKTKDEKSADEIEMQMRKLQRISDQIAQLKAKMAQNTKEYEERNRKLKEEREQMMVHLQALKGQMNKLRDLQRERLTKMTLESNEAIKQVNRLLEKGEKAIKLGEMARKYETEEEKVLPFYTSSLTEDEQEDVKVAVAEKTVEPLATVMHKYLDLDNFWKRYNKVNLEKLALEKEKSVLVADNQQYRNLLKQYLDGISVNDEILSQKNPLVVVNGSTNITLGASAMDPRVKPAPQVVLEAAHIAQQRQLVKN